MQHTSSESIQKLVGIQKKVGLIHILMEDFEVPLVNGILYRCRGRSLCGVCSIYEMLGDTIKVFAEYIDENTNLLYTSWISIVLEVVPYYLYITNF